MYTTKMLPKWGFHYFQYVKSLFLRDFRKAPCSRKLPIGISRRGRGQARRCRAGVLWSHFRGWRRSQAQSRCRVCSRCKCKRTTSFPEGQAAHLTTSILDPWWTWGRLGQRSQPCRRSRSGAILRSSGPCMGRQWLRHCWASRWWCRSFVPCI